MEWLSYRNGVTGELSYEATCGWETGACYGGSNGNPWTSVYFFGEWGDGTSVYPSSSSGTNYVTAPNGSTLATPIILPSIRLKHQRDGMQDYEYLNVLTTAGKTSLVTTEINSWITNSYKFETTGAGLLAARSALGSAMHGLTYSVTLLPPTGLTVTVN